MLCKWVMIFVIIVSCEICILSYFRSFLVIQFSYIIICVNAIISFLVLEFVLAVSVKICCCGV